MVTPTTLSTWPWKRLKEVIGVGCALSELLPQGSRRLAAKERFPGSKLMEPRVALRFPTDCFGAVTSPSARDTRTGARAFEASSDDVKERCVGVAGGDTRIGQGTSRHLRRCSAQCKWVWRRLEAERLSWRSSAPELGSFFPLRRGSVLETARDDAERS